MKLNLEFQKPNFMLGDFVLIYISLLKTYKKIKWFLLLLKFLKFKDLILQGNICMRKNIENRGAAETGIIFNFLSPEKFALYRIKFLECLFRDSLCVAREQISNSHLIKQPRREDYLEQVVDYQSILKLKRFSVLHKLRTQCFDDVDISEANEQCGEGRTHQQPISRPRICKKHQSDFTLMTSNNLLFSF